MEGGEPFAWDLLVPHVVHPLKVAIVEAMHWVGRPLSASDLTKLIDDPEFGLSHVSYHLRKLADGKVIEKVHQRQLRGSIEKFYVVARLPPLA